MQYFKCTSGDFIKILTPNCESIMPNSIWRVLGEGWDDGAGMPCLIIAGHDIWGNENPERDWYCDDDDYIII